MRQRLGTVVFADLSGSTALYEALGNMLATQLITRAMQAMGWQFSSAGGRVVKYLGDGVLVLFDDSNAAVDACVRLPAALAELSNGSARSAVPSIKVGVEYGAIVEHDGDCYGDAVNVASRLSDLAEANEILLGDAVFTRLRDDQRAGCHSLDRIAIKGKSEAVRVWRVDWGRTAEATLIFPSVVGEEPAGSPRERALELIWLDLQRRLPASEGPLVIGRGEEAGFIVNDPRVSRRHARIEWSGGQCLLTDFSSNGTWVRLAGSPQSLMLRRDGFVLHGEGEIALGAAPDDFTVPTLGFRVLD
ncbi:adenylate/guanylate cyclase domain-containing protein [Pseudothauera lacus]|uniref:Adenylate/guanylate cyclase domain-containing protein n=1 Tax=Pseudothauera lacus TaxID=2136175 RepID=A0A2T4IEX7_9RHOO|nr:adenylate/guanylate cyclase domain-containing protein [Pseudothauera lacus]PTD96324.1 adenylate/guanylate cyclase domain-containing protein [Pseudothauera lacus]